MAALVRAPGEVVGQSIHSIYRDKPALLDNLLRALTGETFRTELHLPGSAWDAHYAPVRGAKRRSSVPSSWQPIPPICREPTSARSTRSGFSIPRREHSRHDLREGRGESPVRSPNRAGEELTGYGRKTSSAEAITICSRAARPSSLPASTARCSRRARCSRSPKSPSIRGKVASAFCTPKIPIRDEQGVPRYLLGISEDITQRKEIEEQHQRVYDKLQELDRLKADFVAHISRLVSCVRPSRSCWASPSGCFARAR